MCFYILSVLLICMCPTRRAVSHLTEEEQEAKLQYLRRTLNLQGSGSNRKSQHSLLMGALKRKS